MPMHERTTMALGLLKDDPKNPRRMKAADREALRNSIRTYGIVEELVVDGTDFEIIGGHSRKREIREALVEAGVPDPDAFEVPVCIIRGFTKQKTRALNVALNKIGGDWDFDLLATLLAEVDGAFETGFSELELGDMRALAMDGVRELGAGPELGVPPGIVVVLKFDSVSAREEVQRWLTSIGMRKKREAGAAVLKWIREGSKP